MDIAKSSKISRFAPHPVVAPVVQVVEKPDVPARSHPMLSKAKKLHAQKSAPAATLATKSSQDIKNDAIAGVSHLEL